MWYSRTFAEATRLETVSGSVVGTGAHRAGVSASKAINAVVKRIDRNVEEYKIKKGSL